MQIKRNNRYFLIVMLLVTLGQTVCGTVLPRYGLNRFGLESLIPYLIALGIGILLLKKDGIPFLEALPYNKGISPLTAGLCVLLVFTLAPLNTLLAQIIQNIGVDLSSVISGLVLNGDKSFAETLFTAALIPAVFEEMFFRGFFYAGFRRARGARCSVILTSVLFGLFHQNLQQLLYAAAIGLFLASLRELTGSMWPGMIYHFVNNGWACLQVKIPETSFFWKLPVERVNFLTGKAGETAHAVAMLLLGTAASVYILYVIARRAGRAEEFRRFFPVGEGERKGKLFTAPLVIALILLILVTVGLSLLLALIPEERLQAVIAAMNA